MKTRSGRGVAPQIGAGGGDRAIVEGASELSEGEERPRRPLEISLEDEEITEREEEELEEVGEEGKRAFYDVGSNSLVVRRRMSELIEFLVTAKGVELRRSLPSHHVRRLGEDNRNVLGMKSLYCTYCHKKRVRFVWSVELV